jgi:hypothetical protein
MGVLSLTVTNMILAILNAPTKRLSRPINQPPSVTEEKNPLTDLLKSLTALREKSSASLAQAYGYYASFLLTHL